MRLTILATVLLIVGLLVGATFYSNANAMYQQRNLGAIDIVFYGNGQAPPVPFTHGNHVRNFPCYVCHHEMQSETQRPAPCRACHQPFAQAAHNSCGGCHQKLFRRVPACQECHRQ